jgi:hypothetical protein
MDQSATGLGIGRTSIAPVDAQTTGARHVIGNMFSSWRPSHGKRTKRLVRQGDIKASLKPHRLSISGKSEFGEDHRSRRHNHSDGHAQLMFRVIGLPCEVDLSKAKATLNRNTLEVVMPRAAPVKGLRVETRPGLSSEGDTSAQEAGGIEAAGNPSVVTGANEPMVKAEAASSKG